MAIFLCSHCEYQQDVDDKYLGKKTKCPKCGNSSTIQNDSTNVALVDTDSHSEPLSILHEPGGSIQTVLSPQIVLNDRSTLQREFVTIIDRTLPLYLGASTGITTQFEREDNYSHGSYKYNVDYFVVAKESVHAYEIRFLAFDVWGKHVCTLATTVIEDIAAKQSKHENASWALHSEQQAAAHYASIAFVSTVRTATGKVVEGNYDLLMEEAKKFNDKFSPENMEPS